MLYPRQIAKTIVKICEDKKGEDPVILDVRNISSIASYFVIVSGNSTRHVAAMADHVSDELKKKGERVWHIEGIKEASWVVLDYGDVIAHIFHNETRKYYMLERLWGDAIHVK